MKKTALILFILAAFMFVAIPQTQGATGKATVNANQRAGAQIKTKYFELTIPAGWFMPQPVKEQPNKGISAVFAPEDGKLAITINVMPVPISAKEIATQTAANMTKTGLKTSQATEKNGFWVIDIEGKAKGQAWFGSNGKNCSVITVFGANLASANDILEVLKGTDAKLFPRKIE